VVVVSFHGMDVQTRSHDPSYETKLRELLRSATLVLARSNSLLEALKSLGCPEAKLRMNRTGIPLDQFAEVTRALPAGGAWQFAQACRLIPKKGIDDALHAFAKFHRKFPAARFAIAGEGPLRGELEKLTNDLGLGEAVRFCGFLKGPELCNLFQQSHVFLHPSRMTEDQNQEGVPNAMLEAMATGLPVLATRHGGIPEAVRHGVSGILVAERDRAALQDAMISLAAAPDRWKSMGLAAADDVRRNFEAATQIANLEEAYDEAVALLLPGRAA
jgi:colanic acid/amylovoran biosynthesis glycosyltransferase